MARYATQRPITFRQKMAVEHLIRGRFRSKASALRSAGYSEAVVRQPHKVFGSPTVMEELFIRGHGDKAGVKVANPPELRMRRDHQREQVRRVDFSALTQEELRLLKERLNQIY